MSISPPGTYPESAATIRAQCERLSVSQVELARRVGVAPVTVNRWSTGATRPDPRTLRAIKAMRKRIEVNAADLTAVLDAYEACLRDYLLEHEGDDHAWADLVPPAFTRLRTATTKTQGEPMNPISPAGHL